MSDKPNQTRDEVLRRMLKTPPKSHGEMKLGRREADNAEKSAPKSGRGDASKQQRNKGDKRP